MNHNQYHQYPFPTPLPSPGFSSAYFHPSQDHHHNYSINYQKDPLYSFQQGLGISPPNVQLQWSNYNYLNTPINNTIINPRSTINNNEGNQKVKLPPLTSFYSFKKPIVVDPFEKKPLEEVKTVKPITKDIVKPRPTINNGASKLIDPSRVCKNIQFKKRTKFLSKIIINEDFLIKHIADDPSITINYDLKIQRIEISQEQLDRYVLNEFLFDILKFNDKRDSTFLIDNFPENRISIDLKFDLQDKIIKIWLELLKTSESNITKDEILIELTKYVEKFMESPNFNDPNFDFNKLMKEEKARIQDKNKANKDNRKMFRPSWRLGAKDELSLVEMEVEVEEKKDRIDSKDTR